MKTPILFLLLPLLFFSCSKERSSKWEVTEIRFYIGVEMVNVSDSSYSKNQPFDTAHSTNAILFFEEHALPESGFRNSPYTKQFLLEIPDSLSSFNYRDSEIFDNLNCFVYHQYLSKNDGFYRIANGFVNGKKSGGLWTIEYEIQYGGKHNTTYRMVKNAFYRN